MQPGPKLTSDSRSVTDLHLILVSFLDCLQAQPSLGGGSELMDARMPEAGQSSQSLCLCIYR